MRKSRLSQQKQTKLIEHFIAGITTRCAAEIIGVNRNTGIYYYHQENFELFLKECEWRFNTPNYKEQLSQLKSMVKGNLN